MDIRTQIKKKDLESKIARAKASIAAFEVVLLEKQLEIETTQLSMQKQQEEIIRCTEELKSIVD